MSSDFKIKFGELMLSDYFDLTSYPTGRNDKRVTNVTSQVANGVEILSSRHEEKMIEFKIFSNDRTVREIDEVVSKAINQGLAKLVFSDFPNEYYLAKLDGDAALYRELEDKSVVGTLNFIVPDGLSRYDELKGPYTATRGADGRYSITAVNEGNVDASITMTATMNAENGYVGMYTDYAVTEIGNKEESDTVNYTMATTILNTTNFTEFKRYTGINPENSRKGNDGTSKLVSESGINYWRLDNPGTDNGYWHGSSYVFDFPADGTGHVGSKNVYSYFNAVFWAGAMGQTADMQIFFLDKDNNFVMGYDIYKQDTNGNIGVYAMLVGDGKGNAKLMKAIHFTTSHQDNENPFNRPRGPSDIRKRGDKITFHWWGSYPEFVVPELKNVEITKCMINQYQLGNRSGSKLMSYFDFRNLLIVNDDAQYVRDIKNRYPEGTKVTVTGADSKVHVNGLLKLTEKVDGSNLFTIPPGETTIYFQCSDWCTTPPTYQIEFSEANL